MNEMESSQHSPTLGALAKSLAKAQGALSSAKKESVNPHFRSKYADLASIWDACRSVLSENDLAVVQSHAPTHDGVTIITTLIHASGEWIRSTLWLPVSKQDAQGFGSAITYGRRYSLAAICGVAADDDDGEAAVARPPVKALNKYASTTLDEFEAMIGLASSVSTLTDIYSSMMERGDIPSSERARLKGLCSTRRAEIEQPRGRVA